MRSDECSPKEIASFWIPEQRETESCGSARIDFSPRLNILHAFGICTAHAAWQKTHPNSRVGLVRNHSHSTSEGEKRFRLKLNQDRTQLTAEPILLNVVLAFLPSAEMAAMQTTTMRANITAYSTAVGPSSFFRNETIFLAMLRMRFSEWGNEGNQKMTHPKPE